MKILAKNIRYLRKRHNMSQEQLAVMLGKKTFTTIQKWETDKAEPSLENVAQMAKFFMVNIDDLVKVDLELEDTGNATHNRQFQRLKAYFDKFTDGELDAIQSIADLSEDVRDSILHQIEYEREKEIKRRLQGT